MKYFHFYSLSYLIWSSWLGPGHICLKPPKNSKMRWKWYLFLVKQKIACNSCSKKSHMHVSDTRSDILTEVEGWCFTGLKRSIFVSEEETCTLPCFKEPKQHLDTVKPLLSYRQINSGSSSEPSQAAVLQGQHSIPSWSSQLHAEPGDSSPNRAPRAAPKPNPGTHSWQRAEGVPGAV